MMFAQAMHPAVLHLVLLQQPCPASKGSETKIEINHSSSLC
jgi:hypothetical protein